MKSFFDSFTSYGTCHEALSIKTGIELIDIFIRDRSIIFQVNFVPCYD